MIPATLYPVKKSSNSLFPGTLVPAVLGAIFGFKMTSGGRFILLLFLGPDPRIAQKNYLSPVPHQKKFTSFLFPKQDTCNSCFWTAKILLVISRNKHLSHSLVQSNIIKTYQSNPVKLNLSWKHSHCVSRNIAWGPVTRDITEPCFEREIKPSYEPSYGFISTASPRFWKQKKPYIAAELRLTESRSPLAAGRSTGANLQPGNLQKTSDFL